MVRSARYRNKVGRERGWLTVDVVDSLMASSTHTVNSCCFVVLGEGPSMHIFSEGGG